MAIHHPAKFSDALIPVVARYVDGAETILDPFAGTGRVGMLRQHLTTQPRMIYGNEIEQAWADEAAKVCDFVVQGDARELSEWAPDVDAIVTSPTYGNRMADACDWAVGRKDCTYTGELRKTVGDRWANLAPGNSGAMQWGDEYRTLHREAWAEAWKCLCPGGRLVLNIADHIRDGVAQGVPEWHVSCLLGVGFRLLDWVEVSTPRYGFGANADKRCPELVICLQKPASEHEHVTPWTFWPDAAALNRWLDRPAGTLWAVQPEPQQLGLGL